MQFTINVRISLNIMISVNFEAKWSKCRFPDFRVNYRPNFVPKMKAINGAMTFFDSGFYGIVENYALAI